MRLRSSLTLAVLVLVSCNWETHEVRSGDVQVFIPEQRFRELHPGMTGTEVTTAIGAPRTKHDMPTQRVWYYGVYRGDSPSLLRFLFGSKQPPATLLEGRVTFSANRVG